MRFFLTPDAQDYGAAGMDLENMLETYSSLFPQGLDTSLIDSQSVKRELWFLEASSVKHEILANI